jgi:hypothetical protein
MSYWLELTLEAKYCSCHLRAAGTETTWVLVK